MKYLCPHFQSPRLEPLKEDTLAGTYKSVSPTCAYVISSACIRSASLRKIKSCMLLYHLAMLLCLLSVFSFSTPEHSPGSETNVCEGEGCGAVSASSQNLHRCHQQPTRQPAVGPFIRLAAFARLRISL